MSNKKLVIFGLGEAADVLFFFFKHHSEYTPVAFTVDRDYIPSDSYKGLPVVAFEDVETIYDPKTHAMFVALGYTSLNQLRANKLVATKEKGYEIISYIHPDAGVPSDLTIGENCFIMHNVHIHPHVKIGDNVFIWSGTILCHHSSVGNHCWFTSGVNIAGNVNIGSNCFFAINSTVTNNVTIGDRCFLGANSLVNKDLENDKVMIVPATKEYVLNSTQFLKIKKNKI
jgi:sugar O-acyltransferase (sialic acid O-acetyltransferase NeuD family)